MDILIIQNAADLEWSATALANTRGRGEFMLGHFPHGFHGWFAKMRMVILLVIFFGQSWLADAGQVIDVQGHYVKTLYRYGKPTSESLRVTFSITLSKNTCGILATNMDDTSVWETVIYDGTNTYLLTPIAGHSPKGEREPHCVDL